MRITKDTDTGSIYIKLRNSKITSQKTLGENIVLDINTRGSVVGIEIIDKNTFFSNVGFFKWFTWRKIEMPAIQSGGLKAKKG